MPAMPPPATVIADPPTSLKPYEVDLLGRVQEFGWQTTSVGADDDNGDPAFSYTTGFWLTIDQPEVIVFDFPPQLSHDVFGQIMRRARAGDRFPLGQAIEGILSNEPVYLFTVGQVAGAQYLRSSDWFYRRGQFPAVQLVWADGSGRFPWEAHFDASLVKLQPDLSPKGWLNELGAASKSG